MTNAQSLYLEQLVHAQVTSLFELLAFAVLCAFALLEVPLFARALLFAFTVPSEIRERPDGSLVWLHGAERLDVLTRARIALQRWYCYSVVCYAVQLLLRRRVQPYVIVFGLGIVVSFIAGLGREYAVVAAVGVGLMFVSNVFRVAYRNSTRNAVVIDERYKQFMSKRGLVARVY